ncbi:MAG: hypothetical protein MZW92_68565 [Comamonadaceae bacterium]|nr:hypothetical protein [Comamonadaceae bacterium]
MVFSSSRMTSMALSSCSSIAGVLPGRVVVDDDVGLDADALDDPALAVQVVAARTRAC